MSKKNKKDIVEESLSDVEDDLFGDDLMPSQPYREVDYGEQLNSAQSKAQNTVESLLQFYFDEDLIEKEQYLKFKKATAEQTISQLLFLMETGKEILIKLMQNIDNGEMAPRMFEVLAQLQKSHLDIVKSYSMSIVSAEEDVRRIQMEMGESNAQISSGGEGEGSENKLTTNNPKDLLKALELDKESEEDKNRLQEVSEEVAEKAERLKPERNKNAKDKDLENIEEADFEELNDY